MAKRFQNGDTLRRALLRVSIVIAMAMILFATIVGDSNSRTRRELQHRIDAWRPESDRISIPVRKTIVETIDITGVWRVQRTLNASTLVIRPLHGKQYTVEFMTHGCLGGLEVKRIGILDAGVLTLDLPVSEYTPATYATIFVTRVEGVECLLPAAFVERFHTMYASQTGKMADVRYFVYQRVTTGARPRENWFKHSLYDGILRCNAVAVRESDCDDH